MGDTSTFAHCTCSFSSLCLLGFGELLVRAFPGSSPPSCARPCDTWVKTRHIPCPRGGHHLGHKSQNHLVAFSFASALFFYPMHTGFSSPRRTPPPPPRRLKLGDLLLGWSWWTLVNRGQNILCILILLSVTKCPS